MTAAQLKAKRDELYSDYLDILEKEMWTAEDHEMMHYMAENMIFLDSCLEK